MDMISGKRKRDEDGAGWLLDVTDLSISVALIVDRSPT
jgi:hypothetical protein